MKKLLLSLTLLSLSASSMAAISYPAHIIFSNTSDRTKIIFSVQAEHFENNVVLLKNNSFEYTPLVKENAELYNIFVAYHGYKGYLHSEVCTNKHSMNFATSGHNKGTINIAFKALGHNKFKCSDSL